MRYIFFLFIFLLCSRNVNSQTTTQPGLRDYQITGGALPDSILYILATDTTDGSAKQGLGKFHRGDSLRNYFKDYDWLKYRTGKTPNNTDTMYHVGVATVGDDSIYSVSANRYSGIFNVFGRIDQRMGEIGDYNIAIGYNAGRLAQTGSLNVAIGSNALNDLTTGQSNVAIGSNSGTSITTGSGNFALGTNTLVNVSTTSDNVAIGGGALNSFTGSRTTAIGASTLSALETGSNNIGIGYQSGLSLIAGSSNTFIGNQSGGTTDGSDNTFIGYQSGRLNEGSGNVFIGKESGENETGSNLLYIDNSNTSTPLIHGDLSADTLRINGDLSIRDAVSGASTDSVLVWTPSNGRVKMRNASAFGGSAGTDLTIGGAGPSYLIESSTGTDVTISSNTGISLTESPANTLVFTNDAVMEGLNSSDATNHYFDLLDWTASSLGTLTLTEGTGITLTTSGTSANGIVTIASTVTDTDDQNLTIEGSGPTYDIAINDGTDVTLSGAGIITLSESPANTLVITGTEVDGSTTNEAWTIDGDDADTEVISNQTYKFEGAGIITTDVDAVNNKLVITGTEVDGSTTNEIQTLDATGASQPFTFDLSSDASDITVTGAGITTVTRSGNALTWTSTEVDGSTTNETNTIEEGNVSVQTGNLNIDFQSMFDVAADGGTEVNVSFDGGEATTVTTAESDDYLLMHDSGSSANQKMLWSDFVIDIIGFEEDNLNEGNGNTFDFGTGLDLSVTGAEADISLDFNEFATDAVPEGDEFVVLSDGAGVQEKVAITYFTGGTDTNFAEDDLAFTGNRIHDMDIYDLELTGDAPNFYILDDNGGSVGNMLVIASEIGAGTGQTGGITFQYQNSGVETDQFDIDAVKRSSTQSTLAISAEENDDATLTLEKNADWNASNTTESHLAINAGFAITQNYDGSTGGNDLSIDRSYYYVNITGGNLTDTIKLPEVASTTDNWSSSLSATQCQVGQEYVISNLRSGVNLVIGAYNPAGTSDDLIGTRTAPGGSAGSAISIAPGKSVIVKCYQLAGGIGYWNYWLSN